MEILKIENLTKIYGSGENEVRALDDVSFSVEKGEFFGNNRSVRQRKIHAFAYDRGVDRPTSGRILMNGQDVYAQKRGSACNFPASSGWTDISVL